SHHPARRPRSVSPTMHATSHPPRTGFRRIFVALRTVGPLAASLLAFGQTAPADQSSMSAAAPSPSEAVVLSPFEVTTARDVGFVANSSLAGGRLAGELKDTPAAYSVLTREFIDALGIVDLIEASNWTVNSNYTPT